MNNRKALRKSMAFILTVAIILSLMPMRPAFAAGQAARVVSIDGDAADTNPANTFKGYGAVSANNTSRLLLDYKEEHPVQYWEMMNLLFNQDTGAGINHVKVEMGNDSNTSSGTEPATKRAADETANVRRGAGFIFAADAKRINPEAKVSILRWTEPNWVQPWSDGNTDPSQPATIAAYERMYKWYKDTAIALRETYGFDLDYINPDRNETSTPNVNFIKWFASKMRSDAAFPNYNQIKIVASDENTTLNIPTRMLADPELMKAVDVMAYHYNMATSADYLKVNADNKKEVWYSEGVAPQTLAKYRANAEETFGGVGSALDVAGRFIGMYTQGKRTHYMFQPAVSAFYNGAPYSSKEIISARDPWSGYYTPDVGISTVMHFTQFAANDWMYIPNASAGVVGSRGNSEMDGNATDAEYNRLVFVSPDKKDFSAVMVNDSEREAYFQFNVKKNIEHSGNPVQVWETRGPDYGQEYDANWYQRLGDISAVESGDMYSYTLTVKPHSMVSLTSTAVNPNTGNARASYERNEAIPKQTVLDVEGSSPAILYEDDFEYSDYAAVNGLSYIERRGGTPRYTADQGGAFEVAEGAGKDGSSGMKQIIYGGNKPGVWTTTPFSYTVLGDERWANYQASIDFKMDQDPTHTSDNYVAVGVRHKLNHTTSDSESGYKFRFYADGSWRLIRLTATVASGKIAGFDASKWHRISIKAVNRLITVSLNGETVSTYTDQASGSPLTGQAMIQTSLHQTVFDNLTIEAVDGYVPYATERIDDLDSRISYHEGNTPWSHSLSGGFGRLNRTITSNGASILFSSTTTTEGTPNRWYFVRNEGNSASWSSNSANAWTGENGSYASLTFNGTGIEVYGVGQGTDAVVRMDVYLDDFGKGYVHDASKRKLTGKAYSNGSSSQLIYQVSGLEPGVHNVKIVKTAAASGNGNYMSIEKAIVKADTSSPTSFELPFEGTGFNLVGDTANATLDIFVDHTLVHQDVAIPAASVNRTDTYSYGGLVDGPHMLKVAVKAGTFSIDSIDILGAVYGTVTKTELEALINQVSSYKEDDYLPAEWSAFSGALAAAQSLLTAEADQYAVDSAFTALQNAANALRVKSQPVAVTGVYPAIVATKVGQQVVGLPESVAVTLADGTLGASADIHWLDNIASRFTAPYSAVQLTGEIVGGKNLFIQVQVEVVPDGLVYLLDAGGTGDITPPFTAIKNLMGDRLLNDKADQLSTGNTVWGHTTIAANYKQKAITGAVVITDKSQTGIYGSDTRNNPLVYALPLTAGEYTITSFHRDWWSNGNRTMDISLSYKDDKGETVTLPVKSGLVAGSGGTTVAYDFTLPVDGTVQYSVNNTYTGNQAALISYLGVAKKTVDPADQQEVGNAKKIIEDALYKVNQETANREAELKTWLLQTIHALEGFSATGVSMGEITISSFEAAADEVDGGFEFTAALKKGLAEGKGTGSGTIIAIRVPDAVKPVIALNGEATVNAAYGESYTDAGATASDDRDGDITEAIKLTITYNGEAIPGLVTTVPGTYIFHYNVSDAAGNQAVEVTRAVIVGEPAVTPTPTPSASPTASPEATPTASPSATPTASPEATPTASPSATPTASPEATPTASPSATPTTSPEATPTTPPGPIATAAPTSTPATVEVLSNKALKVEGDGSVTALLSEDKAWAQLPNDVFEIVGDKSLQIIKKNMVIELSKSALMQLQEAMKLAQSAAFQIKMSAVKLQEAVSKLVDHAVANHSVHVTAASDLYDFDLKWIGADGKEVSAQAFSEPVTMSFKVDPAADPDVLGVYRIEADGTIHYVGGTFKDGTLTATVKEAGQYGVLAFHKVFSDVSSNLWASDVIKKMAAKHIIAGVSDTAFNPQGKVTRAEFAAMIARALQLESVNASAFQDVDPEDWYAGVVSAVSEAGIVLGRNEDTFAPNASISREEMAVMVVRAAAYLNGNQASIGNTDKFKDAQQISGWAQEAASIAQEAGLIQGRGNNYFAPQASMTRAEAAQVIANLIAAYL
ncbi:S-layer homology domain-containing protein [Paenibacillus paridis]|uniref:S-layer homology domain-containing protein n=1 Tax=Paenibacillus paridis TaxID=2583376 RepID=UPI00112299B4|nr:S-layer homology domain-containing protein [Paenibacillus paridis]